MIDTLPNEVVLASLDRKPVKVSAILHCLREHGVLSVSPVTSQSGVYVAVFEDDKVSKDFSKKLNDTHWLVVSGRLVDLFGSAHQKPQVLGKRRRRRW